VAATGTVRYVVVVRAGCVGLPHTTISTPWIRIVHHIRARRFDDAQELLDSQLPLDPSLEGLIAVLTALEQATGPAPMQQGVRGQALQLALAQTAAGAAEPLPWVAVARLSLEDGDDAQFRQATQTLVEHFPDNEYAQFFNGVRQLQDGDWPGAEQSLRRASALGVPASNLPELLQVAVDHQRRRWPGPGLVLAFVACLAGLGLLLIKVACWRTCGSRSLPEPS
jgi:hypothetical protein